MLLLTASMAVTQELYLNEKPMPHVYVIVSCKSYILMRKQCLMFMLLLAASTAVTQSSYTLMTKQCLMFMLLLAASMAITQGYVISDG